MSELRPLPRVSLRAPGIYTARIDRGFSRRYRTLIGWGRKDAGGEGLVPVFCNLHPATSQDN